MRSWAADSECDLLRFLPSAFQSAQDSPYKRAEEVYNASDGFKGRTPNPARKSSRRGDQFGDEQARAVLAFRMLVDLVTGDARQPLRPRKAPDANVWTSACPTRQLPAVLIESDHRHDYVWIQGINAPPW